MNWKKAILCTLFGYLGVHKFMEKKTGMGFLYLFTLGLFGIGWIVDTIRYLVIAIKGVKNKGNATLIGAILLLIAVKAGMSGSDDAEIVPSVSPSPDVQITATVCLTATPTVEPTATPTVEATAEPTISPTKVPTASPTFKATKEPNSAPIKEENPTYIGNKSKSSGVFHKPNCGSVKNMKESNKVYFYGDRQEVIDNDFEPCKKCNP